MRISGGAIALFGLWALGCGDDSAVSGGSGGAGGAASQGGAGGAGMLGCDLEPDVVPTTATALTVLGDTGSMNGIFDPSPFYRAGAGAGVMSYSSVAARTDIHTRVATSDDGGASWTFVADANAAQAATVPVTNDPLCAGSCTGTLIHEVSTLVEDPSDTAERRYKLFSHRYLVLAGRPEVLRYDIGHLALQTAPAPEGPWTASTAAIGWAGTSPFSQANVPTVATDEPELADCLLLTEPAALVVDDTLYLAAGCANGETLRVVLFSSNDHAATFTYEGVLLEGEDGACLGGDVPAVNGAHLFELAGEVYLIATPARAFGSGTIYRGCSVMRVADLAGAQVERTAAGDPAIVRRFDVDTEGFTGACAYAEGASAQGYLVPWADLEAGPAFQIVPTGLAAP
ncbi:MAG: hypothetical protein IPM79_12540 [Polyangiaceae bacterium]|nr:hypothetical protein [Polyangiaceae bacterium]MBK8938436.1 hypothetical protein [Polyangiaceae bacterium]